ncbi:ComEC/Rec2 family competence protein [Microbacterium sp. CFBP9023]|uniref:ComEC/Rec2 family competence protein n=1 Tax=Microbacterium sp. CFBP9023 TaxID=3096535 RepID=UPI002A69BDC7|nr:ComEC/Rec2 family competence protein [Microbacterium sp. CFBP9023]MDY0983155.1 ComEC/Rec2 family competence protein [Microbacterium sp. CFBP9023]
MLGAAASLLWMLRRSSAAASMAGVVLVMLAAIAAVSVTALAATPAREGAASWDGRVVEATGEVSTSASVGRDGRLWMEVQLTGIGSPGSVRAASAPVRVGFDPAEGFDLGATVRVKGEAAATDPGERAALVVFASEASVEEPASGVFAVAAGLRSAFIDRAQRLPEPGAGLLPGLAVGDTRAVSTELNDDMRTSGLSHLTAVSGDIIHLGGGCANRLAIRDSTFSRVVSNACRVRGH